MGRGEGFNLNPGLEAEVAARGTGDLQARGGNTFRRRGWIGRPKFLRSERVPGSGALIAVAPAAPTASAAAATAVSAIPAATASATASAAFGLGARLIHVDRAASDLGAV